MLGKSFKDRFGHLGISELSGIVGSRRADDHGVPYSLTEEFVTVYRMHPLLPDKVSLRNIDAAPGPNKSPSVSKEYVISFLSSPIIYTIFEYEGVLQLVKLG